MGKECIFCGCHPQEKTKEHVIPRWLLEATGDPGRVANFGLRLDRDRPSVRTYSFDQFVFPACYECNERFAKLEGLVKPVVNRLLGDQCLGEPDLNILLDWLDEIRVGLWLAHRLLNKNPAGITPKFHIETRVGLLDRMVAIARISGPVRDGVSFLGPALLGFQMSPTNLVLRINHVCFLNASGQGLCSQRLGFPFLDLVEFAESGAVTANIRPGSGRIMYPLSAFRSCPGPSIYISRYFGTSPIAKKGGSSSETPGYAGALPTLSLASVHCSCKETGSCAGTA